MLIGNINYQHWGDLPNIRSELTHVATLLKNQGFTVHSHWNLSADTLADTLKDFLTQYGAGEHNRDNRLVVFYSGHGETRKGFGKDIGYIIPVDNPKKSSSGFLEKAVNMGDIVNWSMQVKNKHILFLFDSCFSGKILEAGRGSKNLLPYIYASIKNPVRQFITAGGKNEVVPAVSRFVPAFIRAIKDKQADYNQDHYVTGSELAMYLANEVPKYTLNHPQVGHIGNGVDDEGNMVFSLDNVFVPEIPNNKVRLTIKTSPENARIRILNIIPKYRDACF